MSTPAPSLPELRAIQKVFDVLEPFNPAEQERVVAIAVALHGHSWMTNWIPRAKARRYVNAAFAISRKTA